MEMAAYPTEGNPLEAEGVRGSLYVELLFFSIQFYFYPMVTEHHCIQIRGQTFEANRFTLML